MELGRSKSTTPYADLGKKMGHFRSWAEWGKGVSKYEIRDS